MSQLVDVVTGLRHTLGAKTRIGRDPSCDLQLDDLRVSREHAEIRRGPNGEFQIIDLGSRSGVLVGGAQVSRANLCDGDEILLGTTRLRFEGKNLRFLTMDHVSIDSYTQEAPVQSRLAAAPQEFFRPAAEVTDPAILALDYEKLRAVFELMRAVSGAMDLPSLLSRILETLLNLLDADRGAILLFDPGTTNPILRTARTRAGTVERWVLSRAMIDEVVTRREGIISDDAGVDLRFARSRSLALEGVRSVMCVPMLHRAEITGVIYVDSQRTQGAFSEQDLHLLLALAGQSALVVKNARLRRDLEDVTDSERRRLERTLRGLADGVMVLDDAGRISLMNPRAEELLPALSPAKLGDVLTHLGSVELGALAARNVFMELEQPGPPRRVFQFCATPSKREPSSEREIVVVVRDITETRLREENVARSDRLTLVGQLAGGIAHDFNNLLCVISSYTDLCISRPRGSSCEEELLEIQRAALAAATLTRQLLAFSRREPVQARVVNLDETIADLHKILTRTAGGHISIDHETCQGLWRTKADPGKLEQVLMNLVVNSRDAMPMGGALIIRTANVDLTDPAHASHSGVSAGRFVRLSVIDNGCGMSPEVQLRVFEPFFTTKEIGKGTGLGLATVFGIVQQAGGNVVVSSEVGKGTTVEVLLPATEDALERETDPSRAIEWRPGNGRTVLLVEDEPGVRRVAARVLRNAGFVVLEAADGEAGLRALRDPSQRIDLVLSDVLMPKLAGPEMVGRSKGVRPDLPVLFMSGHTEGPAGVSAALGTHQLLRKPFVPAELILAVTEALGGPTPPSNDPPSA